MLKAGGDQMVNNGDTNRYYLQQIHGNHGNESKRNACPDAY